MSLDCRPWLGSTGSQDEGILRRNERMNFKERGDIVSRNADKSNHQPRCHDLSETQRAMPNLTDDSQLQHS